MGARLYNPTTATFTTPDPVEGGNDTTYGYPDDPINKNDVTGQWSLHDWASGLSVASACVSFIPIIGGGASLALSLTSAYLYYRSGDRRAAWGEAASGLAGLIGGGVAKFASKLILRASIGAVARRAVKGSRLIAKFGRRLSYFHRARRSAGHIRPSLRYRLSTKTWGPKRIPYRASHYSGGVVLGTGASHLGAWGMDRMYRRGLI
jgi:hypothetical protein